VAVLVKLPHHVVVGVAQVLEMILGLILRHAILVVVRMVLIRVELESLLTEHTLSIENGKEDVR